MRKIFSAVVVATLLASMIQGGTATATSAKRGTATYYLALGDSLSVGFQPGRGETAHGYADVLARRLGKHQIPDLAVRNVGCAGETSRSLITGKRSLCRYAAGSQLDAAVAFLEGHPGQVAFITIDVGSNDLVDRCLDPRTLRVDRACTSDLVSGLGNRLTLIVAALETATGPGVPIVGMSYYNPFLGLWGLVPGGRALARADQRAWAVFNEGVTTAFEDAGASVASVAKIFRIDDFEHRVHVRGRGWIPVNVALACRWTWFCSSKAPGDPHANRTGYRRIAHMFAKELKVLLP
ncbi:MAG TPA: SGNH/GDSL hydrolase family protein [Actinomycetota bacterium]|nr:SGNH/GDSL hydrolase family protein [Actinomycetota bacterium]